MATSSCLKCGHTAFEKAESAISGLRFPRDFVQCAGCGGVIGVIESDDLNARLDGIEHRLKTLSGPAPTPGRGSESLRKGQR